MSTTFAGEKEICESFGGSQIVLKERRERGEEEKEREGRKEEMERGMESIRKSSHLVGRPCVIFFHYESLCETSIYYFQ